jgi:hypothetical protein
MHACMLAQEGEKYTVKVTRLADFGAFVEFASGVRTLLHISGTAPACLLPALVVLCEGGGECIRWCHLLCGGCLPASAVFKLRLDEQHDQT